MSGATVARPAPARDAAWGARSVTAVAALFGVFLALPVLAIVARALLGGVFASVAGSAAACLLARLAGIHSLAVSLAPVALCDAGPPAPQGRIGRPAQFTPPPLPDRHATPGRRGPPLS